MRLDNEKVASEMIHELREGMRPLEARAEKAFLSWLKSSARFEANTGKKWLRPMLESPRSMFHIGYMLGIAKEAGKVHSSVTKQQP